MASAAPFANLEANFIGERFGPQLAKFLAQQLEKSGVHPEKIFKQTGWFKNLADEWSYEVAPKGARLRPEVQQNIGPSEYLVKKPSTEPNRQPSIERFDPNYPAEPLHSNSKSARLTHEPGDPYEMRWAAQNEIPNTGEVLEDSDLFGYIPELQNTTMMARQPSPFQGSNLGPWEDFHGGYGYDPGLGHAIGITGSGRGVDARMGITPIETAATHELQHNINAMQGSQAGANPDIVDPQIGYDVLKQATRSSNAIRPDRNSNPILAGLYDRYDALRRKTNDYMQRGVGMPDIGKQIGYEAGVGETEARNAEFRTQMLGGIPMTDSPEEAALRRRLTGQPDAGDRPADVHPFRTMDYPPDLQYLRTDLTEPIDAKTRPAPFLYNWMYR